MNQNTPKLCGGILLNLLANAKKKGATSRQHYNGLTDQVRNSDILLGLIKIANARWNPVNDEQFEKYVSYYNTCSDRAKSGYYLPFDVNEPDNVVTPFIQLITTHYDIALKNTSAMIHKCLDIEKYGINLVDALLSLIRLDDSIDKTFIYNNEEITKEKLLTIKEFDLTSLLLGVWFYIVSYIPDTRIGAETYKKWHDDSWTEKHGKKPFKCPLWKNNHNEIEISVIGLEKISSDDVIVIELEDEVTKEPAASEIPSTSQANNFNSVFTEVKHNMKLAISFPTQIRLFRLDSYNCKFDTDGLQTLLYKNISNYVYSRVKIDNMIKNGDERFIQGQAERVMRKIASSKINQNGDELGQMLVYTFLEEILCAPKLMSRAELDTDLKQYQSECESVHLLTIDENTPIYQLVFGTSNIIGNLTQAIDNAFDNIVKISKNEKNEIKMIDNTVFDRFFDEKQIRTLKDILLPSPGKTTKPDLAYGVFLGYSFGLPTTSDFDSLVNEKIESDIKANVQHIIDLINEKNLSMHSFYFYVLPFNNAENEKKEIIQNIIKGDVDL